MLLLNLVVVVGVVVVVVVVVVVLVQVATLGRTIFLVLWITIALYVLKQARPLMVHVGIIMGFLSACILYIFLGPKVVHLKYFLSFQLFHDLFILLFA